MTTLNFSQLVRNYNSTNLEKYNEETVAKKSENIESRNSKKKFNYSDLNELVKNSNITNGFLIKPFEISFSDNKYDKQLLNVFKYTFVSSRTQNVFRIKNELGINLESGIKVECALNGTLYKVFSYSKDLSQSPKLPSIENIININPQSEINKELITTNTSSNKLHINQDNINLDLINFYEIRYENYKESKTELKENWISNIITGYHKIKDNFINLDKYYNEKSILYVDETNNFIIIRTSGDFKYCKNYEEKIELNQDQILNFEFYICPLIWPGNPTLRNLSSIHLSFIKNVKLKVIEFFNNKYGISQEYLSFYIENILKSKYFRIGISHVDSKNFSSTMYDNHDLDKVIYNLEIDSEYYQNCEIITRYKTSEYQNYLKKIESTSEETIKTIKIYDNNNILGLSHKNTEKYIKNEFKFEFIHNSKFYTFKPDDNFSQNIRDSIKLVIDKLMSNDTYDSLVYELYSSNLILNGILTESDISTNLEHILKKKIIEKNYPITNILKNILKINKKEEIIYCEDEEIFKEINELVDIKKLTDISIGSDENKIYKYKRWDNYGCILTQANEWKNTNNLKDMYLKIYPFIIDSNNKIRFLKNIRSLNSNHIQLLENINNWIYPYIKNMYNHEPKIIQSYIKMYIDTKILEINVTHVNVSANIDFRSTADLSNIIFNLKLKSSYYLEIPINNVVYQ